MALGITNDILDNGLTAANAYVRVVYFMPERVGTVPEDDTTWEERTLIKCKYYAWDGVTPPSKVAICYREQVYSVEYILNGDGTAPDNVFTVAYDALKADVAEFASATDE